MKTLYDGRFGDSKDHHVTALRCFYYVATGHLSAQPSRKALDAGSLDDPPGATAELSKDVVVTPARPSALAPSSVLSPCESTLAAQPPPPNRVPEVGVAQRRRPLPARLNLTLDLSVVNLSSSTAKCRLIDGKMETGRRMEGVIDTSLGVAASSGVVSLSHHHQVTSS